MYTVLHMYITVYIYIYICRDREREREVLLSAQMYMILGSTRNLKRKLLSKPQQLSKDSTVRYNINAMKVRTLEYKLSWTKYYNSLG